MLARKLMTTDNVKGSTQLDLLAMRNSPVGGSAFLQSYMFTVLGYKGMLNLLRPGNEFDDKTADTVWANGYIVLTNKYRIGESKKCFYMTLCGYVGGQQDYGTSMLIEFLKDLASSDPDLSSDERSLLNDIVMRLQDMYKHDDLLVGHYILQAYKDVLKIDGIHLVLEDVISMLKYLATVPPTPDWDSYSSALAQMDVLEYCAWMRGKRRVPYSTVDNNGSKEPSVAIARMHDVISDRTEYESNRNTEMKSPISINETVAELNQLQRELNKGTNRDVQHSSEKSDFVGDLDGLVGIYQVLAVYDVVPREHTYLPYENTCVVITEDFPGGSIAEFYCNAKLGCKQYHYGDVLRITYNDTMEGCMIQDMRRIPARSEKYLAGEFQIKGEVIGIGYKDESDVVRKVDIKPSEPVIVRGETWRKEVVSINWFEENAGPLPEVGQMVWVYGKTSYGTLEWYTASEPDYRAKSYTSEDTSSMSELDRLQKELNEDLC